MFLSKNSIHCVGLVALALFAAPSFAATNFTQTNLVSDQAGGGLVTDPNLLGCWGMSASASSPIWVSNTASGTSTLYTIPETALVNSQNVNPPVAAVTPVSTVVAHVPPSAANQLTPFGLPTGQVNNGYGTGNFEVAPGHPASFIFAALDGTITAWYGGINADNTAAIMVDNGSNGAFYTGLGIGVSSVGPTLYAANFSKGTIDTFDHNFQPVILPGGFIDPNLPGGYYPFNIQRFGRRMYVTYAPSDGAGSIATSFSLGGPGAGWIDIFDLDGNLLQTLVAQDSNLSLPWGIAVTGANFGPFSYALIVGSFGNGTISAYDLGSGAYLGTMQDGKGNNIVIPGLWGLQWGNGGSGGDPATLYFAAAPQTGPTTFHGLLGSLKPMSDSTLQ